MILTVSRALRRSCARRREGRAEGARGAGLLRPAAWPMGGRRTDTEIGMKWNSLEEEQCSVARTVAVIGDRWSLLILRDCFLRVRRFEDFQERLGITRPILASRLKKLVDEFVLVKVPYQQRPVRYEYRLTQKGLDLYPIVMAIVHWGDVHMAGKKGDRKST